MNELEKLYEEMRQKEQQRNGSTVDDRLIRVKAGNTYRFRLLWIQNEVSGRKEPIINKYSHMHKDDDKSFDFVTCPTSEYLMGKKGFNVCPICKHMNVVYDEYKKTQSRTAKDFYDLYKRQISGYALIYVINDPVNPENNGKVKIFRHSFMIYKYLKWELFGVTIKGFGDDDKKPGNENEEKNAEIIGVKAFDIDAGFDYILTVAVKKVVLPNGQAKEFNDYQSKFSRNPTSIGVPMSKIKEMVADLRFDEDFYTKSTLPELETFLNSYVLPKQAPTGGTSAKTLHEASDEAPASATKSVHTVHAEDDGGFVGVPSNPTATQPAKSSATLIERQPAAAAPAAAKSSNDADVDSILARINQDFGK